VFSYIGYKTKVKKIDLIGNQFINVQLSSKVNLDIVEITADKAKRIEQETQMSAVEIPITTLKKVPALMGEVDILKALQLTPGVKSGGEGQSGIYVRGGGPDQNLILLDGVPVYNVSHLFGFFSVFNADAIKDVKLIKGGYPARYGGRLSSVLEINMKEGNLNEIKGTASIGLISSKLTLEGPINKGKTSFLVSGRRTYLDVLARPFIKQNFSREGNDGSVGYYFYDLNAKINHKFSDKDRIYLSTYTGTDKFYFSTEEKPDQFRPTLNFNSNALQWGNLTTALRWNHIVNPKLFMNTTLTYSDYRLSTDIRFGERRSGIKEPFQETGLDYLSGIEDYGAKIDFDYSPNTKHFIKFGFNAVYHTFKPGSFNLYSNNMDSNFSFSDTVTQKNIKTGETGFYIEDDWTISKNLKVNFGLHYASFLLKDKSYHSLQPRVSSRWLLPKDWSIKGSFATMQQYINLLAFEGIGLPTDLWVPTTDRIKPQDSWQVALGVAKSLGSEYEFSTEIYYKKMKNLVAYKDGQGVFQSDDWQNRVTQGNGDAYGLEVFLQKKEGRLSGWIGYTLAYAYRQFDEIDEGRKFPYRFDRRHDISIVANYNITKKINFAATWVYGTGNAVTLAGTKVESHNQNASSPFSNFNSYDVFGQRNNFRLRPYHRMDVGFNFTKQKKHYERIWSFGAYNAYANNNPFFVYFDTETINNERVIKLKQVALFPLIPYITYTANF
jgi:outer membrane receptor for ferrienterochelin and colicin